LPRCVTDAMQEKVSSYGEEITLDRLGCNRILRCSGANEGLRDDILGVAPIS